jgi:hypothetical protein
MKLLSGTTFQGECPNRLKSDFLSTKEGISGKRVWIGEFGYKGNVYSDDEVKSRSLHLISEAIGWGCPYILQWKLYDNYYAFE